MKSKTTRHILIFLLLTNNLFLFAQDGGFKPSREAAGAAWTSGNYETAFQHYNGLLLLYSRDPLYKYYTGSCLVKLERDVPRAVTLLASAINSSVKVKTVPDDVWFYYGRALQMSGSFSMATDAFDRFVRVAGKKASQAMEVHKFVDQCNMGERALRNDSPAGKHFSEQTRTAKESMEQGARSMEHGADNKEKKVAEMITTEKAVTAKTVVEHPVAAKTVAKQPVAPKTKAEKPADVPKEYDMQLTKAVKLQYAADSLNRIAQNLRREAETATVKEPLLLRAEKFEKDAVARQKEADRIFLTLEPDDRVEAEAEAEDKVEVQAETKTKVKVEGKAEGKNEVDAQGKDQKVPVLSVFEVRPTSAYASNDKIPMGTGAPGGLLYRIQLAAFKNQLPPGYFRGLWPLYGKINPSTKLTYYYTGMFRTLELARQALPKVRNAGFTDAFIIALMDDIQISMERASLLEKEWGGTSLTFTDPAPGDAVNNPKAEPVPVGTLSFRAEVMRSKKPVTPDVTQKIALLSGSRGLDIIKNNQGETIYLIGKFITFESAGEYVSLLIRNGYSNARVAAYVGSQEIPVETARELLKKTDE